MALARYRDLFWFPNGSLAVNVQARVFPFGSNGLATLWGNQAGTIPLTNPLSTDGAGYLDFWAEEGEYWIYIDSRSFRVSVGNPVNLDAWEGASVALSTGLISGGTMAPAGTSVSFGEAVGYVVDYATDDFRPSITRVHKNPQTVPLGAPALARTLTWWLLDSAGNYIQQPLEPTRTQRRTHIVIGYSALFGGVVAFTKEIPQILEQPYNTYADLSDGLGPFIINGAVPSANGVNLSWNLSAGTMHSRSFNHTLFPNDPNVAPVYAQTPVQFRRSTSTTTSFVAPVTTIDPANYDVGGIVTPVPGGANVSTIQRIFAFANDNAADQIVVQYGQRTYTSLSAAVAGVGVELFTINPLFIPALIGWICVIRTATNLSDPAQATFVPAVAKFARP